MLLVFSPQNVTWFLQVDLSRIFGFLGSHSATENCSFWVSVKNHHSIESNMPVTFNYWMCKDQCEINVRNQQRQYDLGSSKNSQFVLENYLLMGSTITWYNLQTVNIIHYCIIAKICCVPRKHGGMSWPPWLHHVHKLRLITVDWYDMPVLSSDTAKTRRYVLWGVSVARGDE